MGTIVLLIFMGILFLLAIIFIIASRKKMWITDSDPRYGKNIGTILFFCDLGIFALLLIVFIFQFFYVVDAGEVGVQVKFGKLLEENLTEGFNTKDPFAKIVTYSIRIKEYTMSSSQGEGAKSDADGVQARTLDNSLAMVDCTLLWAIDPLKAQAVYKKVAKNEDTLIDIVIRPAIRNAIYDQGVKYKLENLMKKRDQLGTDVKEKMIELVDGKGVIIDNVLIRRIQPPSEIDLAIKKKLSAEQELQQKEFELEKAKKDAEIRKVNAQGIADAQKIIQKELTPIYVQFEAIQAYKELAQSNNTTFVIMPTSTEGVGLPLILNAQK